MLVAWRVLVWRSKARAGEFNHLPTFRASAPQEWQILSWLLTFLHPFYCYIGNMVVFPATNIPCDWKITFFWEVKGYLLAFFLHLWSWNSTYNRNRLHEKEDLFEAKHLEKWGALMRLWFEMCNMVSVFSKHQMNRVSHKTRHLENHILGQNIWWCFPPKLGNTNSPKSLGWHHPKGRP